MTVLQSCLNEGVGTVRLGLVGGVLPTTDYVSVPDKDSILGLPAGRELHPTSEKEKEVKGQEGWLQGSECME